MANIIKKLVWFIVKVGNGVYKAGDFTFDFISNEVMPARPSYKLAIDYIQIPQRDISFMEKLLDFFHDLPSLLITPFLILNDKKFVTHSYESSNVFYYQNTIANQASANVIEWSEKMIIYLCDHSEKILDPEGKLTKQCVRIQNNDYDVPVGMWCRFKINENQIVYFYVYISIASNYKGVLFAADRHNMANLSAIKKEAEDYYNHCLGGPTFDKVKKLDFL